MHSRKKRKECKNRCQASIFPFIFFGSPFMFTYFLVCVYVKREMMEAPKKIMNE